MSIKTIYFIALFFVAVTVGPALAHLLELPNKINLAGFARKVSPTALSVFLCGFCALCDLCVKATVRNI